MKSLKTIFITLALFLMSFSFVSFVSAGPLDDGLMGPCLTDGIFIKETTTGDCKFGATAGTCSNTREVAKASGSYGLNAEGCSCVCSGAGISSIPGINKTGISQVIGSAIKVILGLSGLVALVYIIWGGVAIMFSQGKPEAMKEAKARLTNGAIGIIIIALAYAITDFVIKALGTITGK